MKLALLILVLVNFLFPQNGIYNIQFKDLNGNTIDMASYRGKEIIVAVFSTKGSDLAEWRLLDSLYQKNKDHLVVIALLADDLGPIASGTALNSQVFQHTIHISFPVAAIAKGKKDQGINQQPLLHWLTNKGENSHFDLDIVEDGQLFVINESGRLFAVLKKKALYTKRIMDRILNQNHKTQTL